MKKLIYTAAIAAIAMGMTACGGKSAEEKAVENAVNEVLEGTPGEEIAEYAESETDQLESAIDETTNSWFTNEELAKFISDGKSGDIDKMIDAYDWYKTMRASLKECIRNLDENAIAAAVALDKANEEVAMKYDEYGISIGGALSDKEKEMTEAQRKRFNEVDSKSVVFFTSSEKELSDKYNEKFKELRYGI